MNWLVIGKTGGIGSACKQILESKNQKVIAFDRQDLDLSDNEAIMSVDLSEFDIIINCTGHTKGTFQGFLENEYLNILDQIQINFIANILLLKNYASNRRKGRYVWINSTLIKNPNVYHSVYGSTKVASKFAIDLIRQEASHIDITECYTGLVKTKMRYTGYCGTKSQDDVDREYSELNAIEADNVAVQIINGINLGKEVIHIK